MADALDRSGEVADLREERDSLSLTVNERLWNEESAFYHDELADGTLSDVQTIGAFWALLAGVVPQERISPFVGHLEDPKKFGRPHRIPSLSADHPEYDPDGGYWLGGVWPPTNYMVLCGLDRSGYNDLAHEISREDLDHVVRVFEQIRHPMGELRPGTGSPGQPRQRRLRRLERPRAHLGPLRVRVRASRRRPFRTASVGRTAPRKSRRPPLPVRQRRRARSLLRNPQFSQR